MKLLCGLLRESFLELHFKGFVDICTVSKGVVCDFPLKTFPFNKLANIIVHFLSVYLSDTIFMTLFLYGLISPFPKAFSEKRNS